MTGFRISVATSDFPKGIKAAIPLAASTGAEGVAFDFRQEVTTREFGDTALRQLQHLVTQHGMRVATGYFPLRLPLFESKHADERIAAIQDAMLLARELRAGTLVLPTGPLPALESYDDVRLIETVNAIAAAGNRSGTIPCLSFGNQSIDRIGKLLESVDAGPVAVDINPVDWLSSTSDASASSKLRVTELSFGNSDSASNSDAPTTLETFLRSTAQQIGHVQGRDGSWTGRGSHNDATVGTGQVDWPMLLALLNEAAYSGWLTVRRETGGSAADDIAQGVAYLRGFRDL